MLEEAGAKTVTVDGKRVAGNRVVASLLWQAATMGVATLPNGTRLNLAPRDWFEVVKFLYGQIDGPPKQDINLTVQVEDLARQLADETGDPYDDIVAGLTDLASERKRRRAA